VCEREKNRQWNTKSGRHEAQSNKEGQHDDGLEAEGGPAKDNVVFGFQGFCVNSTTLRLMKNF
jgi:hypothetical protein